MSNLRNKERMIASTWEWDFLNGCFLRGIKMGDVDGIVECSGFFLVLETKNPGAPKPVGQRILYEAMVKTGLFTVIYIWGKTNQPERIEIMAPESWGEKGDIKTTKSPTDEKHLQAVVKTWFTKANRGKRV